MTKNVWIHIKGVRVMDGEREQVDETGPGDYYKKNGKHYIIGSREGSVVKRLKVTEDLMAVTGNGGGGEMVFEKGKETGLYYGDAQGGLRLDIRTRTFESHEEEALLWVRVEYALYSGHSHVSDNYMEVRICPREV